MTALLFSLAIFLYLCAGSFFGALTVKIAEELGDTDPKSRAFLLMLVLLWPPILFFGLIVAFGMRRGWWEIRYSAKKTVDEG